MARRSKWDIITDMLETVQNKGRIKPTHLMYKSNLSHTQMQMYLDDLINKRLIVKEENSKTERDYLILTEEGAKLLQKLREMKVFQDTFGL